MSHPEMTFPEEWPESCPPDAAMVPDGEFYACAKQVPFSETDFLSAFERNVYRKRDQCSRRGVSVVASMHDAAALIERYPDNYGCIGVAELSSPHGKVLFTPSNMLPSHHTLWPYQGIILHDVFQPISEVQEQ